MTNQNTSNSLSDSLKTVGETILSSGQKVIVVNNVSSYSIDIPVNKDVENLVGTLKTINCTSISFWSCSSCRFG